MIFQKPLGWVQRYLYNVEQGVIPFPQPVLPIGYDFPLEYKAISTPAQNTTAGTLITDVYVPGQERHGRVEHLSWSVTGAPFAATDVFRCRLIDPAGNATELMIASGLAFTFVPMIGANLCQLAGGIMDVFLGVPPVYVPAGWKLSTAVTSAAGGVNFVITGTVWDRLKSYPLRP